MSHLHLESCIWIQDTGFKIHIDTSCVSPNYTKNLNIIQAERISQFF